MNVKRESKSSRDFNECGCITDKPKGSKLHDFSLLGDGELLETLRLEVDGEYWNEKEEKREKVRSDYKPTSWDYPLSLFNRTHPCSVSRIGDKDLLKKLQSVNTSEKNPLSSSTCICGSAESIDSCPECTKIFSCKHENCSIRTYKADPENSKFNYKFKFSCGSTCFQRVAVPVEAISDAQKWLKKYTRSEMDEGLEYEKSAGLVFSPREHFRDNISLQSFHSIVACGRGRPHELSLGKWSRPDTIFEKSINAPEENAKDISLKEMFDDLDAIDMESTTQTKNFNDKKPDCESTHGNLSVEKTEEVDDFDRATRIVMKLTKYQEQEMEVKNAELSFSIQQRRDGVNDMLTPRLECLLAGPTIEDLMKSNDGLHVTHFYSFYEVHVVKAETYKIDIPLLREDIFGQLMTDDGRKSFQTPPYVGTVLLASLDGNYARAVVEIENTHENDLIGVRFLDVGTDATISYKTCFQISKDLLDVPIFGSRVLLKDITPMATSLILKSDFEQFAKEWPKTRTCIVKSLERSPNGAEWIDLHCKIEGVSTSLSEEITHLGKWEWERTLEKKVGIQEDVLCDESTWNLDAYDSKERLLPDDRYRKVSVVSSDLETAQLIVLFNDETESYYHDREVLQRQFERYCTHFESREDIYPALEERIWINICTKSFTICYLVFAHIYLV